MIGKTVSHYRITEKLGAGGMGVVYKAEDTRLDRVVALKFLSPGTMAEGDRERFVREARAAARIQHPNICPIHEIDEHDGQLFFVMAYVEGSNIRDLLAQGPFAIDTALDLAIQIAGGLEAAHRHGIVHRDIKSANVVVGAHDHACILDFGLALRQEAERLTGPGGAIGTPAYMSPEQAQGHPVDFRTDLWSLGVVLFEMVAGQLPFRRDKQLSVLYAIVKDPPTPLPTLRPDAPAELDRFLHKALAKDPAERWQSAGEMIGELTRIRESRPQDTKTLTALQVAPPAPKRPLWWLAAALLVVLALGGYFAVRKWLPIRNALPEEKQIAVLPLDVVGNDETTRTLADGLVETLTSKLTQIEDFQGKIMVVPASEIRSRKIVSAEVARRIYGANLVITGSAQRWGDRIQFTLNLVDTAKLRQVASRTFDFDAGKPTALRDGAVDGVIHLLALSISPAASGAIARGETSNPAAYAEYLRGIGYIARYDVSGNIDRAITSLKRATELDSRYALAFAALGDAYWWKVRARSDRTFADLALRSVRRAIELEPNLAVAHVRLGKIYRETGSTAAAIGEERRALQIAPGYADAYRTLGDIYSSQGSFKEAEMAYVEATRRQPSDWSGYVTLGQFYRERGRNAEAKNAYETALTLTPDNEIVYRVLAGLAIREGRFREATEMLTKTLKFEPHPRTYSTLGVAYYYQHRYEEAAAALRSGIDLDAGIDTLWGNLGMIYRHLPGREAQAREALTRAVELAEKSLQVTPDDYGTRANLAEYKARLGERGKALSAVDQIPESARAANVDPLVLACELSGERRRAIDLIRSLPLNDPALNYLKADPDLESLWRDRALQPRP